jgi:hypothetical protein
MTIGIKSGVSLKPMPVVSLMQVPLQGKTNPYYSLLWTVRHIFVICAVWTK